MAGNAGGLSYSGLINSGKLTLPSVESWGTNMSILRDPPRSIHTRRIDKVGETSSITNMVDNSGNRSCEAIRHYALGKNPMVSVDYGNSGNNGGQRSSGLTIGGQTQSKLPYRILQDGQFRPPVLRQEQSMPLSRLPRVWTEALTNPQFIDYTKRIRNCGTAEDTKEVHNRVLKVCVRPNAVYKIETPISEPFEVKYVIKNPLHTTTTSGIRTMDRTTQHVQEPVKGIDHNTLHTPAHTNIGHVRHVNNNDFDANPYLQDTHHSNITSNVSSNVQITPIEDILDLGDIRTKDTMHINYTTPISGVERDNYIHEDINLSRRIPEYSATTNVGRNIHKHANYDNNIQLGRNLPQTQALANPGSIQHGSVDTTSSREYHLIPKVRPGGFEGRGAIPMSGRNQEIGIPFESQKSRMDKAVMAQFEGRYDSVTPRMQ
jgi:hypothetical protein